MATVQPAASDRSTRPERELGADASMDESECVAELHARVRAEGAFGRLESSAA